MDYRVPGHKFANNKDAETTHREHSEDRDEMGSEPIGFLAFIEHDLERADSDRQQSDAPVVHALPGTPQIRRIVDKDPGNHHTTCPNRPINDTSPTPE